MRMSQTKKSLLYKEKGFIELGLECYLQKSSF